MFVDRWYYTDATLQSPTCLGILLRLPGKLPVSYVLTGKNLHRPTAKLPATNIIGNLRTLPRNVLQMYSEIWPPDLVVSAKWLSSRFNIRLNCTSQTQRTASTTKQLYTVSQNAPLYDRFTDKFPGKLENPHRGRTDRVHNGCCLFAVSNLGLLFSQSGPS